MDDLLTRAETVKRGQHMQPGYVGTADTACAWVDEAVAEIANFREHASHVLSFLDELAANGASDQRKPLNPIIIGGSAALIAAAFREACSLKNGDRT